MKAFQVPFGSAVWRGEVSRSKASIKLLKVVVGIVSGDDLRDGMPVEEFMRQVWQSAGCRGFMSLTLVLSGGTVVEIESVNDRTGPQVLAFRHDPEIIPAGIQGPVC
jgi:hypothetical protein